MAHRLIQVGTGGRGEAYCEKFLQPGIEAGRIDPVAAVDVDPAAHENATEHLGLPAERCYTDIEEAFAAHEADWCTIVTPPAYHEDVVDAAVAHDVDILSEKPIADTLEASVRIVEKVNRAGVKMGVTMNHRYFSRGRTLIREFHSGNYGPLNYITCMFTRDKRGEEYTYRKESPHPLLVDASVHHFDLFNSFVDADPQTVTATSWNRPWDNHEGHTNAMVRIDFENGVKVAYEGAQTNAFGMHPWGREYIRGEFRDATLLSEGSLRSQPNGIEYYPFDPDTVHDGPWSGSHREDAEEIPHVELDYDNHAIHLIELFLEWRETGEPMETHVEEVLTSMAIVFAAIESSEAGGEPVDVTELVEGARAEISV